MFVYQDSPNVSDYCYCLLVIACIYLLLFKVFEVSNKELYFITSIFLGTIKLARSRLKKLGSELDPKFTLDIDLLRRAVYPKLVCTLIHFI